jgi:23S rRNA pseudouridine1911/1915/1917 synthase
LAQDKSLGSEPVFNMQSHQNDQQSDRELTSSVVDFEGKCQSDRLDLYLKFQNPSLSRSHIQRAIKAGLVRLIRDGQAVAPLNLKSGKILKQGDQVQFQGYTHPEPQPLVAIPMPLDIVYEDPDLVIVDKPSGLSMHPGAGKAQPTLVQGLLAHCSQLKKVGDQSMLRPGLVHRLDKDTTGLLVVAKNDQAHQHLAQQFKLRTVEREYLALLDGFMASETVEVANYLGRDETHRLRYKVYRQGGASKEPKRADLKFAQSTFKRVATFGKRLTLVKVKLGTGRTHQIRVHGKFLKMSVLGDPLYKSSRHLPSAFHPDVRYAILGLRRQMLHAAKLGLIHPKSGESLFWESKIPSDFSNVVDLLRPYKD